MGRAYLRTAPTTTTPPPSASVHTSDGFPDSVPRYFKVFVVDGTICRGMENAEESDNMTSGKDRTLIEILEEDVPVDMSKYIGFVSSPQAGAIATFSGTTRDKFEGKTVLELQYEAYVPMAVRCVESACEFARSTWSLMSIAVAHRLGPVPVGEMSVFVAVSAVHRADALDACKFLIDEIKASVPIWKKEVYTDGEVWKENKEFLERIPDLRKGARSENNATLERGHKKSSCCGANVRVGKEDLDNNQPHVDERITEK